MYYPTIGLEIHIESNTKSKMFCSCKNDPDEKRPNVNICPVCLGHPGVLPAINEEAVKKVIKTGLALNCQIPEYSKFDRKNYFYPDLPKGYQISQYDKPLCVGGWLQIGDKRIRIRRVHLEEDTGRLLHSLDKKSTLVDFNRAGVPLMELVTEPDLSSAEQAKQFAEELQLILRYLGVSDADMEKGQMRVEVNISLLPKSQISNSALFPHSKSQKLGTKVEIKNLNSFRAVEKAVEYEIKRQTKILKSGKKIIQETRGWDAGKEITVSQREKEAAHDYRYFPEPDLPMLHLGVKDFLDRVRAEIPELPQARRQRFQKEYILAEKEVKTFVVYKDLGEFFEKVVSELNNWVKEVELKPEIKEEEFKKLVKLAANYILTDLQGLLKEANKKRGDRASSLLGRPSSRASTLLGKDFRITAENFAELLTLIYQGNISSKIAKFVLLEMFKTGGDPSQIIEDKGLRQISDGVEIEKIVKKVIVRNPGAVLDYKSGRENALQFLVGKAMAESKGKLEPKALQQIFKKLLLARP